MEIDIKSRLERFLKYKNFTPTIIQKDKWVNKIEEEIRNQFNGDNIFFDNAPEGVVGKEKDEIKGLFPLQKDEDDSSFFEDEYFRIEEAERWI